jgi:hypothetical protein
MYSKRFGMIAMAAAFAGGLDGFSYGSKDKTRINEIDFAPKQPPIPKGCKEYFFNSLGDFLNYNDGVYSFKCVAISDKSAIKKFQKWASKQVAV